MQLKFLLLQAIMVWEKITVTTQKMKFSVKDFFSKCDQIRSFLWIWSPLFKKSLLEKFTFCAVLVKGTVVDISGEKCYWINTDKN